MKGAVAAGHPLTAAAGARVLEEGGNAVDACVAAAFAAWVTESPLTGPGAGRLRARRPVRRAAGAGGGLLRLDPGHRQPGAHRGGDARDRRRLRRRQRDHAGLPDRRGLVRRARRGGRARGRPPGLRPAARGAILLEPAIELARSGVEVSRPQAHLHAILDLILRHTDEGRRVYSRPDGSRLGPGDTLQLPDLGGTFEQIAEEGRGGALSRRARARDRRTTVREGGGAITERDLADYRVVWRRPVRVGYLGHEVISNPPPSSGGILIAYGLALLARAGRRRQPGSAESIASLVEVMREQTRVREEGFTSGLHRGGLARRLLSAEGIARGLARIEAERPGSSSRRRPGRRTCRWSTPTARRRRSRRRPAPDRA